MWNILIIDDSALARIQVKDILESEGFNVYEASSFKQVQDIADTAHLPLHQMDLILLDLYLGGDNGLEGLVYFAENLPDIPVIMLTIEDNRKLVGEAVRRGARDYLLKPVEGATLIHKVRSNLVNPGFFDDRLNSFKTMLSVEINRSLRSKHPFVLVEVEPRERFGYETLYQLKDAIIDSTRCIDQTYLLGKEKFVLILPLTDENGARIVVRRVISKCNNMIPAFDREVDVRTILFPANGNFNSLKSGQVPEYESDLLQRLNLG